MVMAKVTDDLLMASPTAEIDYFIKLIEKRFPISKEIVDEGIKLNGSDINQEKDGTIRLSMERYLGKMNQIELAMERKKNRLELANEGEINAFRSLADEFVWIGSSAVPEAS